jgi:hypothetical protein
MPQRIRVPFSALTPDAPEFPPPMGMMTSRGRTLDPPEPIRPVASHAPPRDTIRVPLAELGAPDDERTIADSAGDYLSEAFASLNPRTINQAVQSAFWHPIDTAKGVLSAQDQVRQEALAAFEAGDPTTGVGKMLDWLVPFLGPRMSEAGDLLAEGQTARGLGALTDVAGQVGGPAALAKAPRIGVSARVLPRNTNPAEASAAAFGAREGIPVDAATATGSPFVRGVQALADRSAIGSVVSGRAKAAQAAELVRVGDELATRVHPTAITAEQAGESLRATLEGRMTALNTSATAAYDQLRAMEAAAPPQPTAARPGAAPQPMRLAVDVGRVKSALKPVYEGLLRERELAGVLQGGKARALVALDSLMTGPDFAPLSIVDAALGDIKALSRQAPGEIPAMRTPGQAVASTIVRELDAQVQATASAAGPQAIKALMDGRAATKQKYAVADVLEDLTSGTGGEPVRIARRLAAQKDTAVAKLKALEAIAPAELPKIGRAVIDDVIERATSATKDGTAGALAEWSKLGADTKRLLFGKPEYIQDLNDFFLLAKKMRENPNPSGTALTLAQGSELGLLYSTSGASLPISIGAGTLSAMLHSPTVVRALTRTMSASMSGHRAAVVAAGTNLMTAAKEAGITLAPAAADEKPAAPSDTPAGAAAVRVGQIVTINGRRIKVTAVHPDGTFDGDPVVP